MSSNDFTPTEAQLTAAFDYAGLSVSPDRFTTNYPVYSSTLAQIRAVSAEGLGETVPAVGFKAQWH